MQDSFLITNDNLTLNRLPWIQIVYDTEYILFNKGNFPTHNKTNTLNTYHNQTGGSLQVILNKNKHKY